MDTLERYRDLTGTICKLLQDLEASPGLIVKHSSALLEHTLGSLSEDQKNCLGSIHRNALKLSLIANEFEQELTLEHRQLDVQSEEVELDDRYLHLLRYPACLGNESRVPLNSISGFSKILLDGTITSPLNDQQRKCIDKILRLSQTLTSRIWVSIEAAKELR